MHRLGGSSSVLNVVCQTCYSLLRGLSSNYHTSTNGKPYWKRLMTRVCRGWGLPIASKSGYQRFLKRQRSPGVHPHPTSRDLPPTGALSNGHLPLTGSPTSRESSTTSFRLPLTRHDPPPGIHHLHSAIRDPGVNLHSTSRNSLTCMDVHGQSSMIPSIASDATRLIAG